MEPGRKQIRSRKFQRAVKRAKTYVTVWKHKYGYSSNDERFKTATYSQILQDVLEDKVFDYLYEYERFDKETNEFVKKREVNPDYDQVEAEKLVAQINKARDLDSGRKEDKS